MIGALRILAVAGKQSIKAALEKTGGVLHFALEDPPEAPQAGGQYLPFAFFQLGVRCSTWLPTKPSTDPIQMI